MGERAYEVSFDRVVRADPDLVWAILSDTNRFDRALGVSASTYTYKLVGEPPERQRVGLATYKGQRFRWIEVGEYALVQEHFRAAHEIVSACAGSIIKTLGDGMMMCFVRPEQAVATSLRLAAHARELGAKHGVDFAVRVGVHQGPCYVVRANERLDLFGSSVNVAARLCRVAAPSQVVASASLLEHDSVHDVLARAQTTVQRLQSELKGFSARYHVAAIDQPISQTSV